MKNKRLAEWLQDHTPMFGSIDNTEDAAFHAALYEGIIEVALHGELRMLDSVLQSAAGHAATVGRELTGLLNVPQHLRGRIWERIGDEIDPEPAFAMLQALDEIFTHILEVIIAGYLKTLNLAHAAQSTEISRLHSDAEKKVMRYAAEVAQANRELERLEQAKTDFISIAAHELKTPLTLIQGYVNILRDRELEVDVHSFIEGINRGAHRMNTIIEDMLDLSAIDLKQLVLALEEVKLEKVIDLVIAQLNTAFEERRQTIETNYLDSLPPIEADARRIHQIFRQILNNAIKYSPDGAHITVIGGLSDGKSAPVDSVKITIKDTGIGIAPEDKEKIFEKFYRSGDSSLHSSGQTKFMGAGPGLGLAIVKGLIEAHGGYIRADSPGFDTQNCPGATFTVILPIKPTPPSGIETQWIGPEKNTEVIDKE